MRHGFLSPRIRLWDLITGCGEILLVATVAGFFGDLWWVLDLFSHFRVQYFVGLAAVALVLIFGRQFKKSAFFGVVAAVNMWTLVPLYSGKPLPPIDASRSYRALLMNVNTQTGQPERVAQAIRQLDPDFVVLEEVNDRWLSALASALRAYPYAKAEPRSDNFGIALFSKHPLARSEIRQVGEADVPSLIAEPELPAGRLTVVATHPLPPGSREYSRLRNDQLARLPALVKEGTSPVFLLGDLNVTPWCPQFKRLLRASGLRDSSEGRGVQGTWPTHFPILLIPIDHCLHSAGIEVAKRALGPNVGSDHYPLVVDFVLSPQSSPSPAAQHSDRISSATKPHP
jgi:endonuclease/exonuclease/phosphatase (EEP) superfamily protein YafD